MVFCGVDKAEGVCVRACVRLCVRACVRACVRVFFPPPFSFPPFLSLSLSLSPFFLLPSPALPYPSSPSLFFECSISLQTVLGHFLRTCVFKTTNGLMNGSQRQGSRSRNCTPQSQRKTNHNTRQKERNGSTPRPRRRTRRSLRPSSVSLFLPQSPSAIASTPRSQRTATCFSKDHVIRGIFFLSFMFTLVVMLCLMLDSQAKGMPRPKRRKSHSRQEASGYVARVRWWQS